MLFSHCLIFRLFDMALFAFTLLDLRTDLPAISTEINPVYDLQYCQRISASNYRPVSLMPIKLENFDFFVCFPRVYSQTYRPI